MGPIFIPRDLNIEHREIHWELRLQKNCIMSPEVSKSHGQENKYGVPGIPEQSTEGMSVLSRESPGAASGRP
jgi:hypothetical protein